MKKNKQRIYAAFLVGMMIIQLVFPVFQSSAYAQIENESSTEFIENKEIKDEPSERLESSESEEKPLVEESEASEAKESENLVDNENASDLNILAPADEGDSSTEDPEISLKEDASDKDSIRIENNLISNFKMTIYDRNNKPVEIKNNENLEIDPLDLNAAQILYGITVPEAVKVKDGDTYEIDLPDFFDGDIKNVPITVGDVQVASYDIVGKKVIITFNDKVNNYDDVELDVNISGTFDTKIFEIEEEVVVEVPYASEASYTVTIRPIQNDYEGEDKKTAGFPYVYEAGEKVKTDRNPSHIDWTVRANDNMGSFDNAVIIDDLAEGLAIVEDSFKVERILRNYKNEEVGRKIVDVKPTITESGFELNLGEIKDAYEISYTTTVERPEGGGTHSFDNNARIILDDDQNYISDSFEGTWSGDLPVISKEGELSEDPQIINWNVKYNYGKENLGKVTLSDELSKGELLPETIKVYEVNPDEDGNVQYLGEAKEGSFKFPLELDADGKAYYIEYSSTVPAGLDGKIDNIVSDDLKPQNTATGSVTVDTKPKSEKFGKQLVDKEGKPYIEWTLKMNTNKIDVNSIEVSDTFNSKYLEFDVNNSSLYELKKDGEVIKDFNIESYEDGENIGFKLGIENAGPQIYEFIYRTYYTDLGMKEGQIKNNAEFVYKNSEGEGILDPEVVGSSQNGPKIGIAKRGDYVINPSNEADESRGSQAIKWTIEFNKRKILLDNPSLSDSFVSKNYEYIKDTFKVYADGLEFTDYELVRDFDNDGFEIKINKKTNSTFKIEYLTSVDNENNLDHKNKVTLNWQNGEESAEANLGKRDPGIWKNAELVINEDGSKSINWKVTFNDNHNVIKNFELSDTREPAGMEITSFKISRDSFAGNESSPVLLEKGQDYSFSEEGDKFIVKMDTLNPVTYYLEYTTKLLPEHETNDANNKVEIKYTGGSQSTEAVVKKPKLGVSKRATALEKNKGKEANPVISWEIIANTDSGNKYVNLVDAELTDTIPSDQKLIADSIRVERIGDKAFELSNDNSISSTDNSFTINLPDGPYQYKVTFDTEILEFPSVNEEKLDRYTNSTTLVNQTENKELKSLAIAHADQDYFNDDENNAPIKTGSQNPDTENIDWNIKLNSEELRIHNFEVIDQLSDNHSYIKDTFVLKDKDGKELKADEYILTFDDENRSFTLTIGDGTIDQAYFLTYSTRLNEELIGNISVSNQVIMRGGKEHREIKPGPISVTAQQWFFGGGGKGRTLQFELRKKTPAGTPLGNVKFDLHRFEFDGKFVDTQAKIVTNKDGIFITGENLRAGRYKLTEVSTPTGYKSLSEPIHFIASYARPNEEGKYKITLTDSNWNEAGSIHASAEGNILTIINEYEPVDVSFKASKNLKGQELVDGQFEFELLDSDGNVISSAKNDKDGNVKFEKQTFNRIGTYNYKIREVDTNLPGVKYDTKTFDIQIIVSEGEKGLVCESKYLDGPADFENTYTADPAKVSFQAQKELVGQDLRSGQFEFELLDSNGKVVQKVSNDENGKVNFTDIEFSELGDYKYKIKEVEGNQGGVDYDSKEYELTVTVSDDGMGQLHGTVNYPEGEIPLFTNSYKTESGEIQLQAKKVLKGRELLGGEFEFRLLGENDGIDETVSNDSEGNIIFGKITYTKPGVYNYTVKEINGNLGGVVYDDTIQKIKVNVVDNGEGQLVANVDYENDQATFVNTYKTKETQATIQGEKILKGQKLKENQFIFELYNEDGHRIQTVENDADGLIEFDPIVYDKPGEYKYTVREVKGSQGGITYSDEEYTVNVSVVDNKEGALEAAVSYPDGPVIFTNTYQPASTSVVFEGKKILEGQSLRDSQFTFELLDENNEVIQTVKNNANGQIIFDEITYDKVGDYKYSIRELKGSLGGITYDTSIFEVEVKVTDNGNGQLLASESYTDGPVVFTNIYTAQPGSIVIEAEKILEGQELVNGQFSFELVDENNEVVQTVKNNSEGQIIFDEIKYNSQGNHTYLIRELEGSQGGVSYDTSQFTVVVSVVDNGEGDLVAEANYIAGPAVFENTYHASEDSVVFEGKKILEGQSLRADQFEFELVDETGEVIQTVKNNANGQIIFDEISYTEAGDYQYNVREVKGSQGGITYSVDEYTINVSVIDNKEGALEAAVSYPDGPVVFTNTYQSAPASVILQASKMLKGQALKNGQFTFELLDENNEVIQTVKNNANGQIIFDEITYDKVGDYKYSIRELKGSLGGITYDTSIFEVEVKVTDDGNGKLLASETYLDGPAEFTNIYTAQPGTIVVEAEKILEGQELVDGQFSFELVDENNKVIQTVKNNSEGQIIFDEIKYNSQGKYSYTIREVEGNQSGIIYDNNQFTVEVNVVDNGSGKLIAKLSYIDGLPVFENTYKPSEYSVVFEGKKFLKGQDLKNDQFEFELVDETGEVIQTVKNNGNGQIIFDKISYDEAGDYKYIVREIRGNQEGISYDENEFSIAVSVIDNKEGALKADVSYPDGLIEFHNTYKPTDEGPIPPDGPGKPDKPGKPDEPVKPDEPGKPNEPVKPDGPGKPNEPVKPELPKVISKIKKAIPSTGVQRTIFGYGLIFLLLAGALLLKEIRTKKD